MTSTLFKPREEIDLETFFSQLHECRNKSEHVHGLHPYPAKFIPHIPRALISALARDRDVVLDPMCGSGTTLVVAALTGHRAVGVDLNPIATLVSRAKTAPLAADDRLELRNLVTQLESAARDLRIRNKEIDLPAAPEFHNREKWFEENVMGELAYAKRFIDELPTGAARDLAFCAFSSILVTVSNQESETRWCAKRHALSDGLTLHKLAAKVADSVARVTAYSHQEPETVHVHLADARDLPLDAESVGLVVTSPPYANSHDYYLYNKLRMFWLGYDVGGVQAGEIGSRNRHSDMKEDIGTYTAAMLGVLRECRRAIRLGGAAAIVVADAVVRGEFFDMREIYDHLSVEAGFKAESAYRFGHREFNATFQRGFGTKREKQTHVLVYRAV